MQFSTVEYNPDKYESLKQIHLRLFHMNYMDMLCVKCTYTQLMVVTSAGMASWNDSPRCQSNCLFIHKSLLASPSLCQSLTQCELCVSDRMPHRQILSLTLLFLYPVFININKWTAVGIIKAIKEPVYNLGRSTCLPFYQVSDEKNYLNLKSCCCLTC